VSLADQAADAEDALAAWAAREESARRLGSATRWSTADLHALPRAVRTRVVRRICALGGADLGALRATVIADIDRALMARAAALGTSSAALRPHLWDLRPGLRVRLDRDGLALVAAGSGAAIP
jgi:tRNA(Ile)-lysidine synthase